jgi:hypothetical protein
VVLIIWKELLRFRKSRLMALATDALTRAGCVQNPISLTGFDVKHPLRIAALDASIGRIPGLQGPPREVLESAPKLPFHRERETTTACAVIARV